MLRNFDDDIAAFWRASATVVDVDGSDATGLESVFAAYELKRAMTVLIR